MVKNAVGGDGTFDFTSHGLGSFSLTTAGGTAQQSFTNLAPGTYAVSETVPAGWDLTGATCSDGSNPASIDLAPGENVTCTFENTKRGSLTVVKTHGGRRRQAFAFTSPTAAPATEPDHGERDGAAQLQQPGCRAPTTWRERAARAGT